MRAATIALASVAREKYPEESGPYSEPPKLGRVAVIRYVTDFFSLLSIKSSQLKKKKKKKIFSMGN